MSTTVSRPRFSNRRYRRMLAAAFLLALLGLLLLQSDIQSQQWQQQQQQRTQALLKAQLALAMVIPLEQNDQQQLQWLAQSYAKSPLIQAIWIHKQDGTLMAEGGEKVAADLMLVSEIRSKEVLGYIRISLDKALFITPMENQQQRQRQWQQLTLLLAGIVGIMLARSFTRYREEEQPD